MPLKSVFCKADNDPVCHSTNSLNHHYNCNIIIIYTNIYILCNVNVSHDDGKRGICTNSEHDITRVSDIKSEKAREKVLNREEHDKLTSR